MVVNVSNITNYLETAPEIYTGGQPSPDEIMALGRAGFKIIINLATDNSPDAIPDEQVLVQEAGMAYVHIPVEWMDPRPQDLAKFFTMFEQYKAFKIFVHCVYNMRVSIFVYLFRVIYEKKDREECWKCVTQIWQPNEIWLAFTQKMLAEITPPDNDRDWQFCWQPQET